MRTIQVLGQAYSTTGTVSIVCNVSGIGEVFNGTVPTVNTAPPAQNTAYGVLFQFDVDNTISNTILGSTITASNGTAYIAGLQANQLNPADFTQYINMFRFAPDLKNNVRLDGVLLDTVEPDDGWHYEIPDGSTLSIDWKFKKLPRGVPGNPEIPISQLVAGTQYTITSPATSYSTDWTTVGAPDSNLNTVFTATGPAPIGTRGRASVTAALI